MAQPIHTVQPAPPKTERDSAAELLQLLTAHRDALAGTLRLLQGLEKAGLLAMGAGMAENLPEILRIVVELLDTPTNQAGARNLLAQASLLSQLRAADLEPLVRSLQIGARRAAEEAQHGKPLKVWDLWRALADPHVNAGLRAALALLGGLGESLQTPAPAATPAPIPASRRSPGPG